jgi:hypothetical protein
VISALAGNFAQVKHLLLRHRTGCSGVEMQRQQVTFFTFCASAPRHRAGTRGGCPHTPVK